MQEIFYVVKNREVPLLGVHACEKLDLIKRVDMLQSYINADDFIHRNSDLFEGLGCFDDLCRKECKAECVPVVQPPRRIPIKLKEKLKATLDSLETRQVISKVEKPENWVSNLVVVEKKDGNLRVCLDPKELNKVIKRPPNVLIPTIEDFCEKLCGKSVFTVLDLKEGFWQIKLDKQSSDLCTISTQLGCYKFNRLPFGISMAPEYFQMINQKNFGNIDGVLIYIDDLLITANSRDEHDSILQKVLERARQVGVRFNKDKIQLGQSSVKYLGHIFSCQGIKIDPDRVRAINAIENPKTKNYKAFRNV